MYRMALLVPLEFPTPFWRSEQWRQIIQLRREEFRELSSSDVQLVFWIVQCVIAALLPFEQIWT